MAYNYKHIIQANSSMSGIEQIPTLLGIVFFIDPGFKKYIMYTD